jgi:hypothetical protein
LACGNNNITRGYLSSQPSGQGARNGIADRLAAGRDRTEAAGKDPLSRGYRSVQIEPEQVKASAERRIAEAKAGTSSGRRYPRAPQKKDQTWLPGEQKKNHRYSGMEKVDRNDQFVSGDGNLTFGRTHVHVVHDEKNDEVRLHISFGEGESRHSEKIALVGATGKEVNAAVDLLTEELRGMRR